MTEKTISNPVFPQSGLDAEQVLGRLDELQAGMTAEVSGKLSVNSLKGRSDIQSLVQEAYRKFFPYNALFSRIEASAAQIENDVLDICVELMSGGKDGRANLTSGGTESIFCALHAMREWAREHKPEVTTPELIAPYSIHATLSKGAHYLGIKVVRVPVADDLRADVEALKAAIGPNTIGIAGSAPSWPYGLVDPIEAMGQLALEHDLWLHVDACVGGYILPFMRQAGADIPAYDFTVPGVRSISADLHKYGYAPKPCSSVIYRSEAEQRYHYVPVSDWPCGLYISQSFVGSRPFAATAACWAVMHYMGNDGYVANAKRILQMKAVIAKAVEAIEGLSSWTTHGPLMMIRAEEDINIAQIVGGMSARNWVLLGVNEPSAIHLTVDPMDDEDLVRFTWDLSEVTAEVRSGQSAVKGSLNYGGAGNDKAPKWLKGAVKYMQESS